MEHKTPYQAHDALGHHLSRYSPNGVDIIEECDDCPMRFLFSPSSDNAITLRPLTQEQREGPNRSMSLDGLDRASALQRARELRKPAKPVTVESLRGGYYDDADSWPEE